jgi:hypothetical protein
MPRKPAQPLEEVPPGPLSVVIRAGEPGQEKIVWGQKVYSYEIDQSDVAVVAIYAHLRPVSEPVAEKPPSDDAE